MSRLIAALSILLALSLGARAETVSFPASDGGKVYGELYPAAAPVKGAILLFHQAGSNRGEYAPIAPRLAGLGYDVLAIDQRAGGNLWGLGNDTVKARGGAAVNYLDALPDLEGSLAYARQTWPGTPVIVWGSSYSASLVFFLAARHPDEIAGLLSFSPGEYFAGGAVREQAAKVKCPVFVTSASNAEEIAAAKALVEAVPGARKTQFVPQLGVHGSATLRPDSNPGAAPIWDAVTAFLGTLPAKG
ncbi:MAG TPA: alpha/beta fold hydrolase [Aliidongia sp.]|nr:alpha/beta fold hydrolase [Aliidongia sp.]